MEKETFTSERAPILKRIYLPKDYKLEVTNVKIIEIDHVYPYSYNVDGKV